MVARTEDDRLLQRHRAAGGEQSGEEVLTHRIQTIGHHQISARVAAFGFDRDGVRSDRRTG